MSMEPCNAHENGVCALHAEEVERRLSTSEAVKAVTDNLNKVNIKLAGILAVGCLGLIILIGSYTYTNIVGERSERLDAEQSKVFEHHRDLSDAKMNQMMVTVSALAQTVAVAVSENSKDHEHLTESIDKLEALINKVRYRD